MNILRKNALINRISVFDFCLFNLNYDQEIKLSGNHTEEFVVIVVAYCRPLYCCLYCNHGNIYKKNQN